MKGATDRLKDFNLLHYLKIARQFTEIEKFAW